MEPREPAISADGRRVACTVTLRTDLAAPARTAVALLTVDDGDVPGSMTLVEVDGRDVSGPRYAPAGPVLAVRVGRDVALVVDGALRYLPPVTGTVEHLAWSPDGVHLLAVVAEPGADAAGAQGSGRLSGRGPAWFPHVMADEPLGGWRSVQVVRVDGQGAANGWVVVSAPGSTTWEAAWCGPGRIVTVQSTRPDEAARFDATVGLVDLAAPSDDTTVFRPPPGRCVGLPAGHPDGHRFAVVTATCSDRTVVAGDVTVVEVATGRAGELDVGFDVTGLHWHPVDADVLVVVGQRGLETVVAEVDAGSGAVTEAWASTELTCGQRYPEIALGTGGSCAMVVEGYRTPPAPAVLDRHDGTPRALAGWSPSGTPVDALGRSTVARWHASDGVEIEGLLAAPDRPGPHPVVTYVHGGPIWAWRNRWSMGYPYTHLLVAAGYAVFHPNPRGSTGRGEHFRSMVIGDLGGAESEDVLSGLDHLVDAGLADPARLGVLGGSHGGFMAAHLVTITTRFAAAVSYCPVTHWPSMRLTTNSATMCPDPRRRSTRALPHGRLGRHRRSGGSRVPWRRHRTDRPRSRRRRRSPRS